MARVFITGAYLPSGGTRMSYEAGLLLADHLGAEPWAVRMAQEDIGNSTFGYRRRIDSLPVDALPAAATADDALVINPSFSRMNLGARFAGLKIMYVQGWNTFAMLDGFMDVYVAQPGFVAEFLAFAYRIEAPAIAPFIDLDGVAAPPWGDRPAGRILVVMKGDPLQQEQIAAEVIRRARALGAQVAFDLLAFARQESHRDFLQRLAGYRYVLFLSTAEGNSLTVLETMALGVTIVGFDGNGNRSFLADGRNGLIATFPDFDGLAERLAGVVANNAGAARMAEAGRQTAAGFTYERFAASWRALFDSHPAIVRHRGRLRTATGGARRE